VVGHDQHPPGAQRGQVPLHPDAKAAPEQESEKTDDHKDLLVLFNADYQLMVRGESNQPALSACWQYATNNF
jgi:hypothetical protein